MALERYTPLDVDWFRVSSDHLARYSFAISYVRGKRVLDVGTGSGYGAAILAASGAANVTAIDIDEPSILKAQSTYREIPNLQFLVDDSERLQAIKTEIDVICSFENIEHLLSPSDFLKAATRVLYPDGILLCSTPDRRITPPFVNDKPTNPYHTHEWYANEFEALLTQGFARIDMLAQVQCGAFVEKQLAARRYCQEIRSNIAFRIGNLLSSLLRRPRLALNPDELNIPDQSCYPLYPYVISHLFGLPWCLVAVCKDPLK